MTDPRPVQTLDWRAFLRLLSEHQSGASLDADTLRDTLNGAAQIDPKRLGALFHHASEQGYIAHIGWKRSTGEAARGHVLKVWERTNKDVPRHVCEVSA